MRPVKETRGPVQNLGTIQPVGVFESTDDTVDMSQQQPNIQIEMTEEEPQEIMMTPPPIVTARQPRRVPSNANEVSAPL